MKLLVELGADPSLKNAEGSTALMTAAGLGTRSPGSERDANVKGFDIYWRAVSN